VVGVPDQEVGQYLERQAEQAWAEERGAGGARATSLRVRAAQGMPLGQTAPLRLLRLVGAYAEEPSFAALAALARHPDVERWLLKSLAAGSRVECWLDEMDCYQTEHVPGVLGESSKAATQESSPTWNVAAPGDHDDAVLSQPLQGARTRGGQPRNATPPSDTAAAQVWEVQEAVGQLVGELGSGARRGLLAWAEALRALMARVYGDLQLNRYDPGQRRTIEGNVAVRNAIVELERLERQSAGRGGEGLSPECSATEAIDMVVEIAGAGTVPEEGDEDSIELLGWLELLLDPAPAAIITGLNDGVVPARRAGDGFLPDGLREQLGMASNRRRLSRDLYTLAALAGSRQVSLIAGRRAGDGTPLAPSGLLFACAAEEAVERIRLFTGDVGHGPQARIARRTRPGAVNRFTEMPRIEVEPVTSMRVTSFRTFLASPYLFYLQDVLGLEERDDGAVELNPLAYGSLIHEVLERFGRGDARHSTDEGRVEQCIMDELSALARRQFGVDPPACIWLQLEFARRRLREFAGLQVERCRDGWLIEHVEWRPPGGPALMSVDGAAFGLRGKIDRVERHESGQRWAVLDYKTGDSVDHPRKAHRGRAGWRDLQLPLYRHLASALSLPQDPEHLVLGYVALPRMPGDVQVLEAKWSEEELGEADEVAREVIRSVRRGEFDRVGERPPAEGVLAALCGVGFVGSGRRAQRGGEGDDA
jgi:ATP-dependent helicase/nuclease subunit B